MKNIAGRLSVWPAGTAVAAVVLVVLVGGCGGQENKPTAASKPTVAPATAESMTGEELLWLQAVEKLLPKMNEVFTDSPTDLTASTLKSFANEARGCSRELARIGSPGARLQPSYALVEQACHEYDKGAKCLADAARIGSPSSSAATRKLEQKITCGFAAAEKGGRPLAEAQVQAAAIKAAAG